MQFSTKIDGFEQKDSQGFENSYNSYEQYPLEKLFIFTIYQNYTLALKSIINILYILKDSHSWCRWVFKNVEDVNAARRLIAHRRSLISFR